MNEPYGHKNYQDDVLETLRLYWRKCRESGNPDTAFYEATSERHGLGHAYHKIGALENGAEMPPDMPFVCLRVPTGGGKTVIAARAIRVYKDELLDEANPLVLWLVPSEAIKTQTVKAMKDLEHPLRRLLDEELGDVEIFDGPEALGIQPGVVAGKACVIVSTIQAYRVDETEGRKVYENNGSLMAHFGNVPQSFKNQFPNGFPHSLANVLRMHRPLVVVDEAQNARTNRSFEMLERFQPRAVLELTATPVVNDKEKPPSNVLHSVSAMQLKAEKMIKLPVVLTAETGFKELMAAAIAMRGDLENEARLEQAETGEHIRPILLFQAEPHNRERETLNVEVLEKALKEDHNIPENQIATHTGEERGLQGVELASEKCPVRYVITQSALKEGWDCPFAYVLCSVANLSSSTAVEQILGRVLRMPRAREKRREALNRAYAFVRSAHFYEAANQLIDQLVKRAGYKEVEAREFFVRRETQSMFALSPDGRRSVTVTLPQSLAVETLPPAARECVVSHDAAKKEVTLAGRPDKKIEKALVEAAPDETSREIIRAAVRRLCEQETIMSSPAERGEVFTVPQMMLELDGEMVSPDEAGWLEEEWQPALPPLDADVPTLATRDGANNTGLIDVEQGRIFTRVSADLGGQLRLIEVNENWSAVKLVAWLDRNIPHENLDPGVVCAWLDAIVARMQTQHGIPLGRLVRERFELRRKLAERLEILGRDARRQAYLSFFQQDNMAKVRVGGDYQFAYDPNAYPLRGVCERSGEFERHYYPKVGDLAAATPNGNATEEFQCAQHIDSRPGVKWWVRNLERQPVHSFWLQTSTDRFYPDFVIRLENGKTLVVEYKGADRAANDDTQEKERLGKIWAERSNGQCFFEMVKTLSERGKIDAAIEKALAGSV